MPGGLLKWLWVGNAIHYELSGRKSHVALAENEVLRISTWYLEVVLGQENIYTVCFFFLNTFNPRNNKGKENMDKRAQDLLKGVDMAYFKEEILSEWFIYCTACKHIIVLAASLREGCVPLTAYSMPGRDRMCS